MAIAIAAIRSPAARNLDGRVGLDAKVGLGSNLTLEATVNPDFGQVEADPAEVNLSAFETFFDERRPFFIEGSDLLTGNVDNYFYSRRIGAPPPGRAAGDFVEYPGDHHDPRRRETDRPPGVGTVDRHARRGDRRGIRPHASASRTSSGACAWRRGRPTASARLQQEFGSPARRRR